MGNQLFGFAAARRLSIINNAELVIDDISGFKYDDVYHRTSQLRHFQISTRFATASERLEPFTRIRRYIKKRLNRKREFFKRNYIEEVLYDFDPRLLSFYFSGTIFIEGYWQSENYFIDHENVIRKELEIIPPRDSDNLYYHLKITNCNSVAVHFRYFDNKNLNSEDNLSIDYYSKAFNKMNELHPDAHYFIFSDHPELASLNLPFPASKITQVQHNVGDDMAYADLWLMSKCNNFIIANSTFSWWGAWLSSNPRKTVIAPKLIKRSGVSWWGFEGLIPESWHVL